MAAPFAEPLFKLVGKLSCLLIGQLQLTIENQRHTACARVLKLSFPNNCGLLRGGRHRGLEIRASLHYRKKQCCDLVAQGDTERFGEQQLAEKSVTRNPTNFRDEMQSGDRIDARFDGRS